MEHSRCRGGHCPQRFRHLRQGVRHADHGQRRAGQRTDIVRDRLELQGLHGNDDRDARHRWKDAMGCTPGRVPAGFPAVRSARERRRHDSRCTLPPQRHRARRARLGGVGHRARRGAASRALPQERNPVPVAVLIPEHHVPRGGAGGGQSSRLHVGRPRAPTHFHAAGNDVHLHDLPWPESRQHGCATRPRSRHGVREAGVRRAEHRAGRLDRVERSGHGAVAAVPVERRRRQRQAPCQQRSPARNPHTADDHSACRPWPGE